jgi:hypothetical protein
MHAFVEVGVQVGSRLCSYGLAGRQPRGMAWCIIASSAPDQPIAASHCIKSWKLSGLFQASPMRDRAMYRLSITEAHLVMRRNLYISAQGRVKVGTW